jgi:acyl transferase domain-containing protein
VYTSEIQDNRIRENISLKKFGNYCIRECRTAIDAAGYLENLAAIAELYVKGYSLDFRALFPAESRRIPLPTYPFSREHYWVATNGGAKMQSKATAPVLHHSAGNKDDAKSEAVAELRWQFSLEQTPAANNDGIKIVPMSAGEKIELFLKQETALQLHKSIKEISTNVSYFDLGLSSLEMTSLVQKLNTLLNENVSPSALFEQKDIQSLAEYLAAIYPSKIDALTVIRQEIVLTHSEKQQKMCPPAANDSSVSPGASLHEQTDITASETETNGVSEEVWWQEVPLNNNGYEKVTF